MKRANRTKKIKVSHEKISQNQTQNSSNKQNNSRKVNRNWKSGRISPKTWKNHYFYGQKMGNVIKNERLRAQKNVQLSIMKKYGKIRQLSENMEKSDRIPKKIQKTVWFVHIFRKLSEFETWENIFSKLKSRIGVIKDAIKKFAQKSCT